MCSQKTGRACGTSGSRELCGSGVPGKRAARLQAARAGTIHEAVSGAKGSTGRGTANALDGVGGEAHALWVSPADRAADTRRDGGKSQACVSTLSRGAIGDEDTAAAADPLEWTGQGAGSETGERK